MLHAVSVPRIGKVRVVYVPVLPRDGKHAQEACEADVVFRALGKRELRASRAGADFRLFFLHIGCEFVPCPAPERLHARAVAAPPRKPCPIKRLFPQVVAVTREKRLQLRLRYRKCIIQLRVDGRSRESRSSPERVKRLCRIILKRQAEHPAGKELRRHVAGKAPFSLRPVPALPDVPQHCMQHAVKKRPLRRFAVCLRFCQKGYRRVEKLSVRAGFFRLAPVKEAERQRQHRKPFIEPAAQDLVPLLPVRHTSASLPHFLQYSTKRPRAKGRFPVFRVKNGRCSAHRPLCRLFTIKCPSTGGTAQTS